MAIDLEALLAPTEQEPPCGKDLSGDGEFIRLERAAEGEPAREFGNKPAEPPKWGDVRDKAKALLLKSKDVRAAVLLVRSLAHLEGLPGAHAGLVLILELIKRYWDALHPGAGGGAGIARWSALAPLGRLEGQSPELSFGNELKTVRVASPARMGAVTVRDVLLATGKFKPQPNDKTRSVAELQGLLRDSKKEHGIALDAAAGILATVDELDGLFKEKLESSIDLSLIRETIKPVADFCAGLEQPANLSPPPPPPGNSPGTGTEATNGTQTPLTVQLALPGEIRDEDDVDRILNEVCAFLEEKLPSHPAPLLIRRAQRLLKKNFVEIIEDLAPTSVEAIRNLAGIKKKEG